MPTNCKVCLWGGGGGGGVVYQIMCTTVKKKKSFLTFILNILAGILEGLLTLVSD